MKQLAIAAKDKSYQLASSKLETRNEILRQIALLLVKEEDQIMAANSLDLVAAKENNLGTAMIKRLELSSAKIQEMAKGVEEVSLLPDPLSRVQLKRELDENLVLTRYSVPIGLIGVIFESRPDAFIQIASLSIKSGNCAILKGGKEATHSNKVLYQIVHMAISNVCPEFTDCIVLAETRDDINELLSLDKYIDLMVPRGSNALVQYIQNNTKIPVLGHADGICHFYVDDSVDLEMALDLAYDSKCQYPAVCNAIETLLVHENIAPLFLPRLQEKMQNVELRGDSKSCKIININLATDEDWSTEYNDLILSIKIVSSMQEAINHINEFGSRHTEAICTTNEEAANQFIALVDASSVMCNASTRFADGFRYGFGAEVGISTSKIHSRGPVGLEGLTIYKYKLIGQGAKVAPYANGEKKFTHKEIT